METSPPQPNQQMKFKSSYISNILLYMIYYHIPLFTNKYVFTQPLYQRQDVTQGQFLKETKCLPNPSTNGRMWHKVIF